MFDLGTSTSFILKDSSVSLKGLSVAIRSLFVGDGTIIEFVLYELGNECEEPCHNCSRCPAYQDVVLSK